MAKEDTKAVVPDEPTIELGEFCARLSEKVRSPELIAGFHCTCEAKGVLKDTAAAYTARFDEFINTPV